MLEKLLNQFKLTYTRIIALGFFVIIMVGALLLMLPMSSAQGEWTSFSDAVFTAVSATCVTGLVVFDTFTHWSVAGQLIILCLIQTGGLGFMTIITMLSIFMKRRISLHERSLLVQSAGTMRLSGVVKLINRIVRGTALFEGIGAVLLSIRFVPQLGFGRGIYYAVFHSVSAFCNAGFDLMGGVTGQFSSFTAYSDDALVSLTLCALIVLGGLGFIVWDDIAKCKLNIKTYSLHSKVVLTASATLILVGWVLFFIIEGDASMAGMGVGKRLLASLFQSITTRTAGFNTVSMSELSESGNLLSSALMIIGGSPGSTAGGLKTTTIAVMLINMYSISRNNNIQVFKRRIDEQTISHAAAILTVYLTAAVAATVAISAIEPYSLSEVLFEVTSAVGTVGLTCGITPLLGQASRIILMVLMYAGRVGGLTLMLVLAEKRVLSPIKRPIGKILIG